eukprot:NODE_1925_length_865_cov_427.685049_g1345_i0.p1 GENE.NODE_1925_length_865_cov_427.685049_g1345_i0~~NODE_1925_length_865_cov_427.685049_g1345_i0.p1  ORF type:complete len:257 (-),score=47.95 NODE_1925_length_865_cov_427.685049_g1345_i0:93-833(-)
MGNRFCCLPTWATSFGWMPNYGSVKMSDKDWLIKYEAGKQSLNILSADIKTSAQGNGKSVGEIRKKITTLDSNLAELQENFESACGNLPTGEKQRRTRLLQKLVSDRKALSTAPRPEQPSTSTSSSGRRGRDEEDPGMLSVENQQLLEFQKKLFDQQDKDLDDLHAAVLRTKNLGLMIGSELDEHKRLLGTLEGEVDTTTGKIQKERRRLDRLISKSKTKGGFCVILSLIIVLILLLLIVSGVIKF